MDIPESDYEEAIAIMVMAPDSRKVAMAMTFLMDRHDINDPIEQIGLMTDLLERYNNLKEKP